MKQKIVIITGPTAVGKTSLSINIAKAFNGEIISADSIQVYRGADIGSAKITNDEMQGVPHHLIDIIDPDGEFNAGTFAELARQKIAEISARVHLPIVVGGTGLYLNALLFPLTTSAQKNEQLRQNLISLAQTQGQTALYEKLKEIDPESAEKIHPNQTDRIIRAIEIFEQTGVKKSELKQEQVSDFDYLLFVINGEREVVYNQINSRVDQMLADGLVGEVRNLVKNYNLTAQNQIMQGIGYKETLEFLSGEISQTELAELIKQRTRNYAKRQLTWFKKMPNAVFVDKAQLNEIPAIIKKFLGENND